MTRFLRNAAPAIVINTIRHINAITMRIFIIFYTSIRVLYTPVVHLRRRDIREGLKQKSVSSIVFLEPMIEWTCYML